MILLVTPSFVFNTKGSSFMKEKLVNKLSEISPISVAVNYDKESPVNLEEIKIWKTQAPIKKLYVVSANYYSITRQEKEEKSHRFRKLIEDLRFPESNYPYWKSIVYDEYLGSLQGVRYKVEEAIRDANPSMILIPIGSVINSTLPDDLFLGNFIYSAKHMGIPVVGFQYAPIIDRNFVHLYNSYDYFLVNTPADKEFLLSLDIPEDSIFVIQEKYTVLWSRTSGPHIINYWLKGTQWRKQMGFDDEDFIVGSIHLFSHRRDVIEIVDALLKVEDVKILVNASKHINRRGFIDFDTARDYTLYKFKDQVGKRIFLIEDQIMEVFEFSDAVVIPADLTFNMLDSYRKPVIVFQLALPCEATYRNVIYTSSKEKVVSVIEEYRKKNVSLKYAIKSILSKQKAVK